MIISKGIICCMMNEEFGFDTEFMTDEEVEDMLDSIVTTVTTEIVIDDNKTSVINPYKIQQVLYTYKVLKYLMKGNKGAKISYELHKPYKSIGSVSVVGRNLVFRKPEWFMKAVELANNFEVYPKTDGTVQMNFTFHGLTNPIE